MKCYSEVEKKELEITKVFHGDLHTNFENAYVIEDYPYGFKRTQMKIWVETKKGQGQRIVTCTLNPKTNLWNKPHPGIYGDIMLLCLLENGHISHKHLSINSWPKEVVEFGLMDEYFNEKQKHIFEMIIKISKSLNKSTWENVK